MLSQLSITCKVVQMRTVGKNPFQFSLEFQLLFPSRKIGGRRPQKSENDTISSFLHKKPQPKFQLTPRIMTLAGGYMKWN